MTVSKDTTLKVWSLDTSARSLASIRTEIAHEKDINCVSVSPDGGLIATGSQDKLAKLWSTDLGLVTVLRGHSRGVWCARFSPVDRLVATGSADATIRLWALGEGGGSCVKTLEGHDTSVLRLDWVGGGQMVTSCNAGLVKVGSQPRVYSYPGHGGEYGVCPGNLLGQGGGAEHHCWVWRGQDS